MLLNGGAHKGRRLLSAQSVRAMTTNRLTPEQSKNADFFPHYFDNHGWAYGVGVSTGPDTISKKPGSFGWDGGFGTSFFVDPNRKLISIVMTQSTDFLFSGALDAYRQAVSQAVGD